MRQHDYIAAAMMRVGWCSYVSQDDLEKEIAWISNEFEKKHQYRLFRPGHRIPWRKFPLGIELFNTLGEAQNWRCCYCGIRTNEYEGKESRSLGWFATIEHVEPFAFTANDHPDNLAIACEKCNRKSGYAIEARVRLLGPFVFLEREKIRKKKK